jgi:hypothetical protein
LINRYDLGGALKIFKAKRLAAATRHGHGRPACGGWAATESKVVKVFVIILFLGDGYR